MVLDPGYNQNHLGNLDNTQAPDPIPDWPDSVPGQGPGITAGSEDHKK